VDHFVRTHLKVKDHMFIKSHDLLSLDTVIELIPSGKSVLIEEVKKKILGKPGKFASDSCFFKK
jgi:hypothetical protein